MDTKKQRLVYLLTDYISANIAWFTYNILRFHIIGIALGYHSLQSFLLQKTIWGGQILFPFFWICIYYHSGYYNKPFRKSRLSEIVTTFISILIGAIIIFFLFILDDLPPSYTIYYQMIGTIFAIQFLCTYIPRAIITQHTTQKIHQREWGFRTLIIGTGIKAQKLTQELVQMRRSLGHNIIGYCQTHQNMEGIPATQIIGRIEDINEIIEKYQVQEILIAEELPNYDLYYQILSKLFKYNLPIKIIADKYDILTGNAKISTIYGMPMIHITPMSMHEWEKNIKQTCDYVCSALALILLSPLFLFIAWKIKRSSSGPIFYKQERIGKFARPFYIYKFRSMYINAEEGTPKLTTDEQDPRITPFGRILRKYRLDELPQFWNVLKGDMSLVGPRPERKYYIDQIIQKAPFYYTLQSIKPGITSWGMVKYGYANSVEKMVERTYFDILYLENMSLIVDLKIIIYTIQTVITGKGI